MSPRWYLSRIFWFGLAGLLMLVVMWVTHQRSILIVGWTSGSGMEWYGGGWGEGVVYAGYVDYGHPDFAGTSRTPGFDFSRVSPPVDRPSHLFSSAFGRRTFGTVTVHFIGIWFITAIYTVTWYVGMVFWLRRKHGLMNTLPPAHRPARHA